MIKYLWPILLLMLLCPLTVDAEVTRQNSLALGQDLKTPGYQWKDTGLSQRALILAIHGATLYGGAYDTIARRLASEGYLVVAPDLKGFGSYYHAQNPNDRLTEVVYERSIDDLVAVAKWIRSEHPNLPLICMGESVGGHLAIRLASEHPELVDGLILSSSSTKVRMFHFPFNHVIIGQLSQWLVDGHQEIDLSPYIRRYISEDPRIRDERLKDPLSRNSLSLGQVLKIGWMSRRTMDYISLVPSDCPVLILQGTNDRLYKPKGAALLLNGLRSKDKKVHWFPKRGHILLETKYLKPDTMDTVEQWLSQHVRTEPKSLVSHGAL